MTGNNRTIDEWLNDIVLWGEKLARHIQGMTREQFLSDERTQDAVSKCAEAIGVAANEILKLEAQLDTKHPGLQLQAAYKSRNRLSHGYFTIDLGLLWNTAARSVPQTVRAAKQLLQRRRSAT
jgi:uncharacterized protein with HEPN domain